MFESGSQMFYWDVGRISLSDDVQKILSKLQLVEIAKKIVQVAFYNYFIWGCNENFNNTIRRISLVICTLKIHKKDTNKDGKDKKWQFEVMDYFNEKIPDRKNR